MRNNKLPHAPFFVVCLFGFLVLHGCAGEQSSSFSSKLETVDEMAAYEEYSAESSQGELHSVASESDSFEAENPSGDEAQQVSGDAKAEPKARIERRIVYNTTVSLVVKVYDVFESQLPRMVESYGGFISKSETDRRYNDRQSGVWVVRVPVARYNDFLNGVTGLGFAESRTEEAQDVTDQYVDVESRIRNNKRLEERILTMLEDRVGKLSDVLEIERELARVREEVERMEGRLRLLADRSAFATITIRCREERDYIPPAAPTLGSRIGQTWGRSLSSLRIVAENLLVGLIAVVPWLVAMAIPLAVAGLIIRRLIRKYL